MQNVPGDKLSAISIHALREEGDAETKHLQELSGAFLSTPSARRATSSAPDRAAPSSDFYPRPPRGGRPETPRPRGCSGFISIHALREEGDAPHAYTPGLALQISIHALREEGDRKRTALICLII